MIAGCVNMVKLLVDSGSSLRVKTSIDYKGRGGRTAASMAKSAGKSDTFELLLQMEKIAAEDGMEKLKTFSMASDLEAEL